MTLPTLLLDGDIQLSTVTVATRTGSGARGAVFATPVTRTVFVEDGRKLVRDEAGEQVVSETTLFDALAAADVYPAGTKVTVNGRAALVIVAKRRALGDPDVDHLEVALT
jgi:hypothetical protein